jgi:hypothetical protein
MWIIENISKVIQYSYIAAEYREVSIHSIKYIRYQNLNTLLRRFKLYLFTVIKKQEINRQNKRKQQRNNEINKTRNKERLKFATYYKLKKSSQYFYSLFMHSGYTTFILILGEGYLQMHLYFL